MSDERKVEVNVDQPPAKVEEDEVQSSDNLADGAVEESESLPGDSEKE